MTHKISIKKIFSDTGILFFERVIRTITTTIIMFLLARYLSIDLLGQLSFAIAFGSIISVVAIMGTDGVTVHELITKKNLKMKF